MIASRRRTPVIALLAALGAALFLALVAGPAAATVSTAHPVHPVKLVFIHHSTGEAWLSDSYGRLALALRANNYFVSDTNYDWGPDAIGSSTDIGNWWQWFRGPSALSYLTALYKESGRHSTYSRLARDPGGSNQIVMFKSCFPNSALQGSATAAVPVITENPLRGQSAGSSDHTVANAKGIYVDLLRYFRRHRTKLFIVVTAPPLSDSTYARNARVFNNWLTTSWLKHYPYKNVFVFDFYDVLTSNGGNANTSDVGRARGNHHRMWRGAVQHTTTAAGNTLAYPTGDDHPSAAGDRKATAEFVPLLNCAYNRWRASLR